ncbi:NUDIX domain-containing protein [Micromonospora carbonacea]|uniref:ADP-ribose pyrophosphatase n=1 Tax=Micromonospora carbonacea TaxID=47853 RepID=A0A7H8XLX4_9ACTN|nr:NUDIX hydrolase [Micromonospora carbonacea]MBB5825980.1 ADP-ribose pyrophosphatase [Micromonospora carbonacea]QLD25568.1 NUDIX hydrolase [Micromonospora carbonacea]
MSENQRNVEILSEDVLLTTAIFTIRQARLRYRRFGADRSLSGDWSEEVTLVNADRGDSAAAVIVDTSRDEVVLVEQFRYPTLGDGSGWLVELVAGMVRADEEPESAIRREIREEIGYDVRALDRISTLYPSPGGSSERVVLFYGEIDDSLRVGEGGGRADEAENIARRAVPLGDLPDLIDSGTIRDAKTLAGLLWLRLLRSRR